MKKVTVNCEDYPYFDAEAETVDLSGLRGTLRIRAEYTDLPCSY